MKTIQLIAILLFASISLDAQEPRTAPPVTKQATPVLKIEDKLQEPNNDKVKKELLDLNQKLQQDLATLDSHILTSSKLNDELDSKTQEYSDKLTNLIERNMPSASSRSDCIAILKEMKEIHDAYYHQYKELQLDRQANRRNYRNLSNIMKVRNIDTERAAINNIR